MSTAQIPTVVADRLTANAIEEHREWQSSERAACLDELARVDVEWEHEVPALDEAIRKAADELAEAEAAFVAAKAKHAAAQSERYRRGYGVDDSRDVILHRLDNELCDLRIIEALEKLADAETAGRELTRTAISNEKRLAIEAGLLWIGETARPALERMKSTIASAAEIRSAIEKLMSEFPPL